MHNRSGDPITSSTQYWRELRREAAVFVEEAGRPVAVRIVVRDGGPDHSTASDGAVLDVKLCKVWLYRTRSSKSHEEKRESMAISTAGVADHRAHRVS